jgi:FolB domain-containing protein
MPNEPNPLSDRIHIEQLQVSTHIGVPEEERSVPQRLTVSISFWPYHETGDLADKIEDAVNYSAVAAAAIHGYRFK